MFKNLGMAAMILGLATFAQSCSDDDNNGNGPVQIGTVTGVVSDELSQPIAGVTVSVNDGESTATTNAAGAYTLENVTVASHIISFQKEDYATVAVTVVAGKFDDKNVATVSPVMEYAAAKIRGHILDAFNGGAPLAGVKVFISDTQQTVSDANGDYEIGQLPLADYQITYTKDGYNAVTRKVAMTDFVDGVAVVPEITMGGNELLPGLTLGDIRQLRMWYLNEYRGGRNGDAYPHWDWSGDYMCTLDFYGNWEEQNEGTTVRIRNNDDERDRPTDCKEFDSFVAGRKVLTADNCQLTIQMRTHNAEADAPAYWGVKVIDMTAAQPEAVLVGGVRTIANTSYECTTIDLSAYVGREICIAAGIFRQQPGDYWKQLVFRTFFFAKEAIPGFVWLPGTPVVGLEGWELTQENVRSMLPNPKRHFTGISPVSGNRDNYVDAYRAWRDVSHIASEWEFCALHKDPEVFPSEGYLIKTRGDARVNTAEPESYLYSKFAIAPGFDKMVLRARNFSDRWTYFKITVIDEDGNVTFMDPVENTANKAEKADDGCWRFDHNSGANGRPNEYASFTYDLSQFDGKNVVVALSVHMGEANGHENKLCIYSVDFE